MPKSFAPECSGWKSGRDGDADLRITSSESNQSAIGVMASSLIMSSSELF